MTPIKTGVWISGGLLSLIVIIMGVLTPNRRIMSDHWGTFEDRGYERTFLQKDGWQKGNLSA